MEKSNTTIPAELIRQELHLLLHCEEIKNSQILSRFLQYVVNETLSGHEDAIKEYTIGVKALGRPPDFNPQLDAVVRIHAGRLRRTLLQYYQGPGKDDAMIISIPKGAYIPSFQIQGDIITAPNLGTTNLISHLAEIGYTYNHDRYKPKLAVLPFHNLSPEHSMDYFVTGIGEQLSIDLARFQNIAIISYYSTHRFDAAASELKEMRKALKVEYVLIGSVRFVNEMVRLNIQLLSTDNGEIMWTESYARHMTPDNIFDIQEGIINQVLNIIADDNGILTKMHKSYAPAATLVENAGVQEAIYQYYHYTSHYNPDLLLPTLEGLKNAIVIEPNNALACAMLSDVYKDIYLSNVTEDRVLLELTIDLAQKSVELDEYCQLSQMAMAWALLLSGKKEKAIETIEHCIALNPKASRIVATMGLAYICLGCYAKGLSCLLDATHLNPTVPVFCKVGYALYYFHHKNFEDSLKWLQRLHPLEYPFFRLLRQAIYGKMHNGKNKKVDEDVLNLKDHALNMISRLVCDLKLRTEIGQGLQLSGLTVK